MSQRLTKDSASTHTYKKNYNTSKEKNDFLVKADGRYSNDFRLQVINECLKNKNITVYALAQKYNIPAATIYYWIKKHKEYWRLDKQKKGDMHKIKNGIIHTYINNPHKKIEDIAHEYDVLPEEAAQWLDESLKKIGYVNAKEIENIELQLRRIDRENKTLHDLQDVHEKKIYRLNDKIAYLAFITSCFMITSPQFTDLVKKIAYALLALLR